MNFLDPLIFLSAPLVMCLILVGIHCYLGIHVLARDVIFVDLSLAQVAALGSMIAFFLGYDHHEPQAYWFSLLSTLFVAFFLAVSNRIKKKVSQEAVIGIIYACSSALIVLLLDKMSHGSEHLKHSLIGQLLWVNWSDVLKVAIIYTVVGVIHFAFRQQLLDRSISNKGHWLWDVVFYGLFGVVITSSVQFAGILVVFSFLIVPALTSSLVFKGITQRLVFGWVVGSLLSVLGIGLSYLLDSPAGALLVVVFTLPFLTFVPFMSFSKFRKARES